MICFASLQLNAQGVQVELRFGTELLEIDKSYYSAVLGDSIKFQTCKFYLSDISIGQTKTQYHLVDLADAASLSLTFQDALDTEKTAIRFILGVDSATTVSGAYDGVLDPANGMYWTWQTGYIHVKLEGSSPVCSSRNHVFQFHLGGYAAPHNALQIIDLQIIKPGVSPRLILDLEPFMAAMHLKTCSEIMSPGTDATTAAQKLASCFKIVQK